MHKKKKEKSFIIGRIFNHKEYAESFLNGKIYINPLAAFGIKALLENNAEMKNKYRGDQNEGVSNNTTVDDLDNRDWRMIRFYQDIGGIPNDADSLGEIDSHFLCENILSFSAIFYENGELQQLNRQILEFSDNEEKSNGAAIIIYDVKQFLYRIAKALSESLGSLYWFAYGLVDYDFNIHERAQVDEFTKERRFNYQQEFRLAININSDEFIRLAKKTNNVEYDSDKGVLQLNIESIKDIAFIISVEEYSQLIFPEEYQKIKITEPAMVCPFYPPVKNEISYVFPLLRKGNKTFICNKGLYPIIRDVNAFAINNKRIKNTMATNAREDSFFMSILDMYCRRLFDICKNKENSQALEQASIAFKYYMAALGVYSCDSINNETNGLVIRSIDNDLSLHEKELNSDGYITIEKTFMRTYVSDFAILTTLSDQTVYSEYEHKGKKYVRVEVARPGVLPSGRSVQPGENVWVEVSPISFLGCLNVQ